ncbi:MAG: T9SS type A sorting domain-containing protein [Bacteroidota bacterium]
MADKAGNIFGGVLSLEVNWDVQSALSEQIQIQPNPFTDVLMLQTNGLPYEADVRILNALGQEIFQQSLVIDAESQLDLSSLAEGMYLLEIKVDQVTLTRKILKN